MQNRGHRQAANHYSDDSVDEIQKHQFLKSNKKERELAETQQSLPARQRAQDYSRSSTSGLSGNIQEHELDELNVHKR